MYRRKWMGFVFIIWFVIGHPLAADAAISSAQFGQGLQKVVKAYQSGQWRRTLQLSRRLVRPGFRQVKASLQATYFLYTGMALFRQNSKALSWKSFEQALLLDSSSRLPEGQPAALQSWFEKVRQSTKLLQNCPRYTACRKSGPALMPTLAWATGAATVIALGGAGISILNANLSLNKVREMYNKARRQPLEQPLVFGSLTTLHKQGEDYTTLANVLYIVGGVLGTATAVFVVLSLLNNNQGAKLASSPLSVLPQQTVVQRPLKRHPLSDFRETFAF